jgi:DNA-binding response OmpR family regulator
VAIISTPNQLLDLIWQIVIDEGWVPSLIDRQELEQNPTSHWGLVIIISMGGSDGLVSLAAQAAHEGGTRVMIVADDRDPQLIADVLRSGVDDYLVAPFHPLELRVRMRAHIHRGDASGQRQQEMLRFDLDHRTISNGTAFLALSSREWDVLMRLLEANGCPVPAAALCSSIEGRMTTTQAVASTIARLRHHLERSGFDAITIVTVRGQGYIARSMELMEYGQHTWAGQMAETVRHRVLPDAILDVAGAHFGSGNSQ